MDSWYAVRVRAGKEAELAERFGNKRSVNPKRISVTVQRGKRHERELALMPGYVFTQADLDDPYLREHAANSDGYVGVLGRVRESEIEDWQQRLDERGHYIEPTETPEEFQLGQHLQIIAENHPFFGQIGICQWSDAKNVSMRPCNQPQLILSIARKFCVAVPTDKIASLTGPGAQAKIRRFKRARNRRLRKQESYTLKEAR